MGLIHRLFITDRYEIIIIMYILKFSLIFRIILSQRSLWTFRLNY